MYAVDPTGHRVYLLKPFFLTVVADGAEIAQMTMSGQKCPICSANKDKLDRTDMLFQPRTWTKVRLSDTVDKHQSVD